MIMGVLENIARKSSWASRKPKMVFYQRGILLCELVIICVSKRQGRVQVGQFSPLNRGLHLCRGLKNREFAAVKFTKTSKLLINICLYILQLIENQLIMIKTSSTAVNNRPLCSMCRFCDIINVDKHLIISI